MKFLRFHPEAVEEADHAALFYRSKQPGLEKRFLEALEDAVARIQRNPRLYRVLDDGRGMRKCRLWRFPYAVIYREKDRFIEVIAVMHLRRPPGYWKTRS